MNVKDLMDYWEETASGELTHSAYTVQLPIEDAAKLAALAEMYPKRSIELLITDLLNAALHDIESSMPYQEGNEVIGRDELGDPLFADIGPTPRFLALAKKHLQRLRAQADPDAGVVSH